MYTKFKFENFKWEDQLEDLVLYDTKILKTNNFLSC
jgi:hypothetical protein